MLNVVTHFIKSGQNIQSLFIFRGSFNRGRDKFEEKKQISKKCRNCDDIIADFNEGFGTIKFDNGTIQFADGSFNLPTTKIIGMLKPHTPSNYVHAGDSPSVF